MILAETPRTRIRLFEKKDRTEMTLCLSDAAVVGPLVTPPLPFKQEHADRFFQKMQKTYAAARPEFFVIADLETDRLIGGIGVHSEHTLACRPHVGEIGYWLGKDFWGQGLMSEALPVILDYAFAQLGYILLVATTNTDNDESRNLLHHMGFEYLGQQQPLEIEPRSTKLVTSWQLSPTQFSQRNKHL